MMENLPDKLPKGWSAEMYSKAKAMWLDGKSAGEIGKAVHKSRNCVIGISSRNNWPRRPSPIIRTDEKTRADRQAAKERAEVVVRGALPAGHPATWGPISMGFAFPA